LRQTCGMALARRQAATPASLRLRACNASTYGLNIRIVTLSSVSRRGQRQRVACNAAVPFLADAGSSHGAFAAKMSSTYVYARLCGRLCGGMVGGLPSYCAGRGDVCFCTARLWLCMRSISFPPPLLLPCLRRAHAWIVVPRTRDALFHRALGYRRFCVHNGRRVPWRAGCARRCWRAASKNGRRAGFMKINISESANESEK